MEKSRPAPGVEVERRVAICPCRRRTPFLLGALCALLAWPPFAAAASGPFLNLAANGVGQNPLGVAIGDVNGDGLPDLVVANRTDNTVSVLLGNGDGSYQVARTVSVGTQPGSVAAADLNRDGKADLVVGNAGDGTVDVLLSNGDGTFQAPIVYGVGDDIASVVAADFTGDGVPDIAVSAFAPTGLNGGISLLVGRGDGTFAAAVAVVGYGGGMGPGGLAVADLNGDGALDLAVTLVWDGNYLELLTDPQGAIDVLTNDGTGHFSSRGLTRVALGPTSVAAGDFNGDGKPDLAVAVSQTANVAILIGNGDGSFQAPTYPAAGPNPLQVATGDLNGDGKTDVIAVNNNSSTSTASVLLGNGDGSFQPPATYDALPGAIGVAVADLNHDGRADAAITNKLNNSVQVFLGGADGRLHSGSVAISGLNGTVSFGDLNGDGKLDFAAPTTNGVGVFAGDGLGGFTFAGDIPTSPAPSNFVAVGDFDHDGKVDVASAVQGSYAGVSLYAGNGDGTFQGASAFGGPAFETGFFETVDVDGLQELGILTRSEIGLLAFNVSDGDWKGPLFVSQEQDGGGLAVTDFDGDGIPDAAVGGGALDPIHVLHGSGDGTFDLTTSGIVSASVAARSLASGDFNGDGILDLVVLGGSPVLGSSGPAVLLLGRGDGTFVEQPDNIVDSATEAVSADLNGDGIADLAFSNAAAGTIQVLFGRGDGSFVPAGQYNLGPSLGHMALVDVNGDGALDLAVMTQGAVAILEGTVGQASSRATTTQLIASPANAVVGQPVTLSASPSGNGTLTGSVEFKEDGAVLSSATLAGGQAQTTTAPLTLGTVGFTARYEGDANFNGSLSGRVAVTVGPATSTTSIAANAPAKLGEAATFTATVTPQFTGTPTGSVQFFADGQPLASAELAGGQASVSISSLAMGSHKIEADYSGDPSFRTSLGLLTIKVGKAESTVTLSSSANPATVGQPVTILATVTDSAGIVPTGPVVFKEGTTIYGTVSLSGGTAQLILKTLVAGTHKITAQYAGDDTNSPDTSAGLRLVVVGEPTSTTVVTDTEPSTYGQTVTFTAAVTSAAGTPDGTVSFKNGASLLATVPLVGGSAQLAVSTLDAGTGTISATYNGSASYAASTASVQQIVEKAPTTTALSASSNPAPVGAAVTLAATVSSAAAETPTGTVAFKDGKTALGTAALINGEAQLSTSLLGPGAHSITATYSATKDFASSKGTLALTVE